MQKITPFFWFDTQAEEAANYYVSIFKNAKVTEVTRYNEESSKVSGRPAGSAMTVAFELNGQQFVALNGGPQFTFSEAISFVIHCETQEEIDHYWNKLTADGGEEGQCGWLKDKYGVSWQVVPTNLGELLGGQDPVQSQKAMHAMLQMKKLDMNKLQAARDQE